MDAVEFERVSYPAEAGECARVREDLRRWMDTSGVPTGVADGVVLAASAAIDNVVACGTANRRSWRPGPSPSPIVASG